MCMSVCDSMPQPVYLCVREKGGMPQPECGGDRNLGSVIILLPPHGSQGSNLGFSLGSEDLLVLSHLVSPLANIFIS